VKREVVFRQDMGRGKVGLRREGDVEEQVAREDDEMLREDEETNEWIRRRVGRIVKVQRREERKERRRADKMERERFSKLNE
jgi:hypothetical protein